MSNKIVYCMTCKSPFEEVLYCKNCQSFHEWIKTMKKEKPFLHIIDNESQILSILSDELSYAGFNGEYIIKRHSGWTTCNPKPPDVVLSDDNMSHKCPSKVEGVRYYAISAINSNEVENPDNVKKANKKVS